jgi:hypothetical protein
MDFHLFLRNSKLNALDAIVGTGEGNMLEMSGFGDDLSQIKNLVKLYGKDENGLTLIATAEDTDSKTSYGTKEYVKTETDMKNVEELEMRAAAELVKKKDANKTGSTTTFLLLNINPGERIWITVPERKIYATYRIVKYTHNIPNMTTTIDHYKDINFKIIKDIILIGKGLEDVDNPDKMRGTYAFTFDDDANLTHIGTSTSSGSLVGTGTCVSLLKRTNYDVTGCRLVVSGQDLGAVVFKVTTNGDVWETTTPGQYHSFSSSGPNIGWSVTLTPDSTNVNPKIDSLVLQYK